MNAGALNGPVVGARSGRWRVWERLQEAATLVSGVYVQPTTTYYMVPIPNAVAAVKLTSCAGCTTDNAYTTAPGYITSYSAPACKDLILPWGDGKQLVVALGSTVTVALFPKGTRQGGAFGGFALTDADVAVQLTNSSVSGTGPTVTGGTATVYWRNTSLVSAGAMGTGTGVQLAVPCLNGTLYSAIALSAVGVTYPLVSNPQTRAESSGFAPSTLFGYLDQTAVTQAMPGQGVISYATTPGAPSQAYVKLEWME